MHLAAICALAVAALAAPTEPSVPLREHFEALVNVRFEAQQSAVNAALVAQKEQTAAAFASAEKAISKSDEANAAYRAQTTALGARIDEITKSVSDLRESRSESGGRADARDDARGRSDVHVGWVIGIAGVALAVVTWRRPKVV